MGHGFTVLPFGISEFPHYAGEDIDALLTDEQKRALFDEMYEGTKKYLPMYRG